ncbi:AAA family ATPase [Bacillus paranthracis]|uniref:AAA family ATPase n=1 Tax=Bacillus paranthracis TaxID=2026186 RepID=UPI0021CFFC82|nr:AAA family ATPase [Bacillus paranthracis]MCU5172105.1 AAA family ATPase [Bacillus paranthracis]
MKLNKLRLKNFQGFEEKEIIFSENFNVLVGENGAGKTAITKAISIALSAFISKLIEDTGKQISQNDIRCKEIIHDEITTVEPQYPSEIHCNISYDEFIEYDSLDCEELEWSCERHKSSGYLIANEWKLSDIAYEIQYAVQHGKKNELPIFVSYTTNRLWNINTLKAEFTPSTPKSRFAGYKDFLSPYTNENEFINWFVHMSITEIRHNKPLKILNSVKTAISNCLKIVNIARIDYAPLSNEILAITTQGDSIPLRLLSDGYRSIIGLVADIAYRMAVLNPFLDDHLKTPGIILIDEIDLHLHPKWQRNIVNDLKSTFPNVQFIVTTHSPFIVQSLSSGELQTLDNRMTKQLISPDKFVNKSLEDVATSVMGITHPQRNEKLQRLYALTKEYYLLVKNSLDPSNSNSHLQHDIQSLKLEIDKLASLFSDNVAYHAILEIEREELERKGKKQ